MTFLERYQSGEYEAVWFELNALGADAFSRRVRDDARAVAMETVRRVRLQLQEAGATVRPAGKRAPEVIKAFEKRLQGKLPLSLHAWWLQIGEVKHADIRVLPLDPNSIFKPPPPFFPPKGAWQTSIEAWRRTLLAEGHTRAETEAKLAGAIAEFEAQDVENEKLAVVPHDSRFRHPLTPDELATPGFNVLLPQEAADFPLENADGQPYFIDWLRRHLQISGPPSF